MRISDWSSDVCSSDLTLVTISTVTVGADIRYQLALHLFQLNAVTLSHASTFHEIATQYGVLAYPDYDLIDRFYIKPKGKNIEGTVMSPTRQRPVFIIRRTEEVGVGKGGGMNGK